MTAIARRIIPAITVTTVVVPETFPIKANTPIAPIARTAQTVATLAIIRGRHCTNSTHMHPSPKATRRLSLRLL